MSTTPNTQPEPYDELDLQEPPDTYREPDLPEGQVVPEAETSEEKD